MENSRCLFALLININFDMNYENDSLMMSQQMALYIKLISNHKECYLSVKVLSCLNKVYDLIVEALYYYLFHFAFYDWSRLYQYFTDELRCVDLGRFQAF